MNIEAVVKNAPTMTGLDPELEAKAQKYAQQEWNMNLYPLLKRVFGDSIAEEDLEMVQKFQDELFQMKYEAVENADNKRVRTKELNLRFAV